MIQNTILLGNGILCRLDELLQHLQLLRADMEQSNLERRLRLGIPFTQEGMGRVLSLSPTQLQRLIATSRQHNLPVPRWGISQREWRWDGRRAMAWAQIAGRLYAGEHLDDLPPHLLQVLNEDPGPGPGPQPGEGMHAPQVPSSSRTRPQKQTRHQGEE